MQRKSWNRKFLFLAVLTGCGLFAGLPSAGAAGSRIFSDNFERDRPGLDVKLRQWNVITSIDVNGDQNAALYGDLCRNTGKCVDLVGSVRAGAKSGGIVTKNTFPAGTYNISFQLYGSWRDTDYNSPPQLPGTIDKIRVYLGNRLIYRNDQVRHNVSRRITLQNVQGAGKLKFVGYGQVTNLGPLIDNVDVRPQ